MDHSEDKPISSHIEHKTGSGDVAHLDEYERSSTEYDPAFVKRTIRKLDIRLLIILGAMYSIALIDRTNLSSARVAGMNVELNL
jgi:hypothetical protein